jgi:flagellin
MSLSSSLEKLSTGLRINRASDDASGLAISETLRANIKGTNAAIDVIANANNYINTADGFLQNVNDILGRMEELAVKAGDATLTAADKTNIKTEYDALGTQIGSINTNAKFNGQAIFSAVAKNFTVDDAGTQFAVTTGALTAPAVMGAGSDGTAELAIIQAKVATVTTQRASLGAKQSQLNYISSGQSNYATNVTAAESRIRDVDVAKETTNFSRAQILVQSSTAMLSQANSLPQSVLKLLQ